MLDEDAYDVHISRFRRHMQWCPPVVRWGCHVSTMFDEEAGNFHIPQFRRHM
jgi:hypothetical protein